MSDLLIREIGVSEIDKIVDIHLEAFPNSAMTSLGGDTVRRFYAWILEGPHEIAPLGAFKEDQLIGYTIGGLFRGATGGFVRKNRSFLVGKVLRRPWLIRNELFKERLKLGLGILFRRGRPSPSTSENGAPYEKQFGLLVTAVHPKHRGSSVFHLIKRAEEIAVDRGFFEVTLSIDPKDHRLAQMYTWLGYEKYPDDKNWKGFFRKRMPGSDVRVSPGLTSSSQAPAL